MTIDLTALLDMGEAHARDSLLKHRDKSLAPFYHLVTPEGDEDVIVPCFWTNDFQKQLMVAVVKQAARQCNAVAALFVGEAWMLKMKTPSGVSATSWHLDRIRQAAGPPSQSPDRIEIVHCLATDGEQTLVRIFQIVRDKPGGKIISLVEEVWSSDNTQFTGRLLDGIIIPEKNQ